MNVVIPAVVSLFGLLIAIGSLFGLVRREKLIGIVRHVWAQPWSMIMAVGVRLVLGAVLIVAAPDTRYPIVMLVLGCATIAAAIVLPFIGHARIGRLLQWFEQGPGALTGAWLAFGLLFGLFLIYAARCAPLVCA